MMRRGYSRDHHPDCEQLVLALIVNQDGFPFSYELFDGNRADVSTVEAILRTVERKHGKARRVWIFDRGVVSEENWWPSASAGASIWWAPRAASSSSSNRNCSRMISKRSVGSGGQADHHSRRRRDLHLVPHGGTEGKREGIRSRFVAKIEKALAGLEKRIVEGKLKDRDKMLLRLGRIQASHPQWRIYMRWP